MSDLMDPIIAPAELRPRLADVSLFDARGGPDAAARYADGHLEGAPHVQLDRDLSRVTDDAARGGRHPLPPPAAFAATLGRLGITPETHVVIYDDLGGANAASRFWWMLRAAGHARVQVLDGGLQAAVAAGWPVSTAPVSVAPAAEYPLSTWPADATVDADAYAAIVTDPAWLAIDARAPARYCGREESFDPNPGHVPGAVNVFFKENLDPAGRFLPPAALAAKYRALLGDRPSERIVLQCGSGVTACHTLLALERAGLAGAKLYVGSFSEWTRQGRPVAADP